MAVLQLHWIVGIILATSPAHALPSNILSNHTLASEAFNITGFNITNAECVGNVGLMIGKFFIFNYITHAFTIKPGVGYGATYVCLFAIAAFFLPYYGLLLACRGIETWAAGEKDALKRAARAGALCVVARTKEWRPDGPGSGLGQDQDQDQIQGQDQGQDQSDGEIWCWRANYDCTLADGTRDKAATELAAGIVNYAGLELEYLSQDFVQIHGVCQLPKGYALARLPPHYQVEWALPGAEREHCNISSNHSVVRQLVGLLQLLAAVPTIYAARVAGNQESHGYAGYQLTVIPYALMSIINTFTNIVTPNYSATYMVRTSIMDEAESRGGIFQGDIGVALESCDKVALGRGREEITGEIGKYIVSDNGYTMAFGGAGDVKLKVTYGDARKGKCLWIHSVKKASHFIFRQHIWEAVREEFPVLRWLLFYAEKKKLRNISAETPIERLNPQRTCIVRLFKRFSERKPGKELGAMILYPPMGNLKPREKDTSEKVMYIVTDVIFILSIAAPYLLTYGLTKYKAGNSTLFQRVIVTLWLVSMQTACIPQRVVWNFVQTRLVPLDPKALRRGLAVITLSGAIWSIPGVIGFSIVFRLMINDHKKDCDGVFGDVIKILGIGANV